MSTQWGPNDWRERGFASFDEYEQWLDDQAQAAALARWRERRTRGERGCFSLLFASLPGIVIWTVVIVLWLHSWKVEIDAGPLIFHVFPP